MPYYFARLKNSTMTDTFFYPVFLCFIQAVHIPRGKKKIIALTHQSFTKTMKKIIEPYHWKAKGKGLLNQDRETKYPLKKEVIMKMKARNAKDGSHSQVLYQHVIYN